MAEICGVPPATPAADGNADSARAFGGKLKPARRRHGQPRDLGDDGAKRAMPQTLLKAGKHTLVVAGFEVHYPIGRQSGLGECRSEQVLPDHAPEHPPPCSCGDARGEKCRRRSVEGAVASTSHLMQCSNRQSASRQMPIDLFDTERQNCAPARAAPFKVLDGLAKLRHNGWPHGRTHVLCNSLNWPYVPYLFHIGESTGV